MVGPRVAPERTPPRRRVLGGGGRYRTDTILWKYNDNVKQRHAPGIRMVLKGVNDTRVDAFSRVLGSGEPIFVTTSRVSDFTDLAVAMLETEPRRR